MVSGTGLVAGCECLSSHHKKISSERWNRGSRKNRTPKSRTNMMTQIDGRSIEEK